MYLPICAPPRAPCGDRARAARAGGTDCHAGARGHAGHARTAPVPHAMDLEPETAEWAAKARALVAAADASSAWVETGTIPALLKPRGGGPPRPAPCARILHVLRRWTLSQHFVKSIWRVDVLGRDGEDCVLRHLLRKHVVSSVDTAADETDRLAEWALWQGPQWKAAADAAADAARHEESQEPEPEPEPKLDLEPEPEPEPERLLHRPSRGREEVLCEVCAKKVMLSELSKHKAGRKHRRALRLAAMQGAETKTGPNGDGAASTTTGPIAAFPAKDSALQPEPEVDLPASKDPDLQEISYHRAVFGPLGLCGLSAEEARRFVLPYDYPKARAYAIIFREYVRRNRLHNEAKPVEDVPRQEVGPEVTATTISMELLPFSFFLNDGQSTEDAKVLNDDSPGCGQQQTTADPAGPNDMSRRLHQRSMPAHHMGSGARRVLSTLLQWAATTDTVTGRSTHGMVTLADICLGLTV